MYNEIFPPFSYKVTKLQSEIYGPFSHFFCALFVIEIRNIFIISTDHNTDLVFLY